MKHLQRAIFQASIWITSDVSNQQNPSPELFGWEKIDGCWKPVWMSVPEVSKSCQEMIKCACKKKCSRCKCFKAQLKCTPLCKCQCMEST